MFLGVRCSRSHVVVPRAACLSMFLGVRCSRCDVVAPLAESLSVFLVDRGQEEDVVARGAPDPDPDPTPTPTPTPTLQVNSIEVGRRDGVRRAVCAPTDRAAPHRGRLGESEAEAQGAPSSPVAAPAKSSTCHTLLAPRTRKASRRERSGNKPSRHVPSPSPPGCEHQSGEQPYATRGAVRAVVPSRRLASAAASTRTRIRARTVRVEPSLTTDVGAATCFHRHAGIHDPAPVTLRGTVHYTARFKRGTVHRAARVRRPGRVGIARLTRGTVHHAARVPGRVGIACVDRADRFSGAARASGPGVSRSKSRRRTERRSPCCHVTARPRCIACRRR
jgi:hypothetical protein